MSWVAFNEAYVLEAMPTELGPVYGTWIAQHPQKADRLRAIARTVTADFRTGLSANPWVTMDPETDRLPERCVRHALTAVFYHLSLEMGLSINMSAQTAFINAEVYMRRLYTSQAVVDGETRGQSPAFNADTARAARRLAVA